ncbi:hypothetical protein [Xanthomonas arboricola]|uniref:hypothetical protein n=1 Tax=Xanthomonas arboricola TaxID=56448 RepID=UPI001955CB0D|nr:hypothetical protein [Xanthomonas arboricola]
MGVYIRVNKVKDGFAVMAFEYSVIGYIVASLIALLSFFAALSVVLIGEFPDANPLRLSVPPAWYSVNTLCICLLWTAGGAVIANGLHYLSNRLEARVLQLSHGSMPPKEMPEI